MSQAVRAGREKYERQKILIYEPSGVISADYL